MLEEARSKLPKPTKNDEEVGELLAVFTERALGAGKVTLLKRLSPNVSKAVGTGYSYATLSRKA